MRRPAALDGAGFGPRASGFRKKERIEALSPDPFFAFQSFLPESGFLNPESLLP